MPWKPLCAANDVESGTMSVVQSGDVSFLVLRNCGGGVLVVPPSCPHMNTDLCDGFFDGKTLTCSKHLWQWSAVDGSIRGIAEAPLLVYRSRETDGTIEVELDQEVRYAHEE
jgi:toluene monooxygenase system ferredoxin subunit